MNCAVVCLLKDHSIRIGKGLMLDGFKTNIMGECSKKLRSRNVKLEVFLFLARFFHHNLLQLIILSLCPKVGSAIEQMPCRL